MSRDTATPKYDIKLNEERIYWYGPGDFPRFSICLYLNKQEGEDDYEMENIEYFPAYEKDMLVDYINDNLQDDLEAYSNIYRITIDWEQDYDNIEEIDIIYENEIYKIKKNN